MPIAPTACLRYVTGPWYEEYLLQYFLAFLNRQRLWLVLAVPGRYILFCHCWLSPVLFVGNPLRHCPFAVIGASEIIWSLWKSPKNWIPDHLDCKSLNSHKNGSIGKCDTPMNRIEISYWCENPYYCNCLNRWLMTSVYLSVSEATASPLLLSVSSISVSICLSQSLCCLFLESQ